MRPSYIVIHHTAINSQRLEVQAGAVNNSHEHRGYHESTLGWYTAYHYLIGRDGTIIHTRSNSDRTGHTKNDAINVQSVAIVLAGNFEDEEPTQRQVATLYRVINTLSDQYGVKRDQIIPHKEASATACPGKNLLSIIERIKQRL